MSYESQRNSLIEAIKAEKAEEKPDKGKLKRLAKDLINLEESACDFTGAESVKRIPKAPTGKRCYKYAKWNRDDETIDIGRVIE